MHISSTKTNIVSKRTEARFHMTQIIKELYQVRPNWFLSISYVPCKPCIYLASRLALSRKRPNRAFTWAPWPRSTVGCVQNCFLSYGRCKLCTYLALKITLSLNGPKWDSIWHMSSRSSIGMRPNGFLSIWYVRCKPCTYLASRLALSRNRSNQASLEPLHLGVPTSASKMVS